MNTTDVELKVLTEKESFVAVEASYIRQWMAFLNKKAKNILGVYVTLQLYTNRQEGNVNYGKSWLSIKRLGNICDMSPPSVHKCLQVLEQYDFIRKENRDGTSNLYTVLALPVFNVEKVEVKVEDSELLDNIRDVMEKKSNTSLAAVNTAMKGQEEDVFSTGISSWNKLQRKKALTIIGEIDKKLKLSIVDLTKYFKHFYIVHYDGLQPKKDRTSVNGKPGADAKKMRLMVDEYGTTRVKKMIKFTIENWDSFEYVNGYPNIAALYGYRETFIPESEAGQLKNKRGQYSGKALAQGEWE